MILRCMELGRLALVTHARIYVESQARRSCSPISDVIIAVHVSAPVTCEFGAGAVRCQHVVRAYYIKGE